MGLKIFVTKQGGIGDVILATPVLAELKKIYPDSYITLLIFANAREVVEGLPFIDEVFVYDKQKVSFLQLWKKMRGYDISLHLDLTYRPAMAAALAGIPVRVGIEHKRKFWLNRRIKWQEYMDHTYEPYVLGDIVNHGLGLHISPENLNTPYIVSATEADCEDLFHKLAKQGVNRGDQYIVSSPITAFYLKNWPLERWNELYCRIYKEYGMKCVIFGSGSLDYKWDKDAVVNLWGHLNLRQVGELINHAIMLVNSDSMPLHMAAAKKTATVVLDGYSEPKRWAPREKCVVVQSDLSCAPCDGYHGTKCTNPKCMKEMSIDEVYAACVQALKQSDGL